MSADPTIK